MTISKIAALLALALFPIVAFAQILAPQGRLTLVTGTPVMTSDVVGASTLYYTPYVGNSLPISNGTSLSNGTFSELSLDVATSASTGQIRDVYAINVSSAFVLCLSPVWGTTSSRGSGGIPAPTMLQGIWVNATAMNGTSGTGCETPSTNYTVAAQAGIYLGTIYTAEHPSPTSALGLTMQFKPAAAGGGSDNLIGIWNAYNRVPIHSMSRDSTASWTDTSTSWRETDSSADNSIMWVDGLQQTAVGARCAVLGSSDSSPDVTALWIGVNLDSTSATPNVFSSFGSTSGPNREEDVEESFSPQLGLHYIQAMETLTGSSPSATFYGNTFQSLILQSEY